MASIDIFPRDMIDRGEHMLANGGCWCQPWLEEVLPFGEIVVHRHFMDKADEDDG
jgi:hypothetical protein